MKLTIVYDPKCPKLTPEAYSQSYRDMFLALCDRFETNHITTDCSSEDIDADVIVFFDIHSSHHIKIDGIENHKAVKYEYFNDPWQGEFKGKYNDGTVVYKLGSKERSKRALLRGINYIICPYTNLYYRFIDIHLPDDMLVWFPIAPDIKRFKSRMTILSDRIPSVLLNGHTWPGVSGFKPYNFRRWAYKSDICEAVEHGITGSAVVGETYPEYLSRYAGSAAFCDTHICPKYSEIPLAGCVCFAQYQYDYEKMGFKDGESCFYVTKKNFKDTINAFKHDVTQYQSVADAGRKLVENNWTSKHFADFIYNHAMEHK